MAFSNAGLGMVHAMAHALGGQYNLPHGVCNAVLLPYVLAFHTRCPVCRERLERVAQAMGLEEVSWFLDRFSTSFGLTLDGLQRG